MNKIFLLKISIVRAHIFSYLHSILLDSSPTLYITLPHITTLLKGWFSLATSQSRSCKSVRVVRVVRVLMSHKLIGIGVGRIRTSPFLPIPFTTLSLMIQ